MILLRIADILLFWIHILVILFNLIGWVLPEWRKYHLISLFVTLFSWLVPGIWYGFGYCFLTDWHWQVKRALGETNLPASFIKYFFDRYTPIDLAARTVDILTVVGFAAALLISVILYARSRMH
jgi:hypothetical protein